VKNSEVNENWAYNAMMNKFKFGNANVPGVYFDEENRRHLNTLRMQYAQVANDLAEHGKMSQAKDLLEKCDKNMLQENFPYGMASRRQQQDQISAQFLLAAYRAGDTVLAQKVSAALRTDLEQQIMYFNSLNDNQQANLAYENQLVQQTLQQVQGMEQYFTKPQQIISPENQKPVINTIPKTKQDTQVHDKTQ
jgi:hypothetical protein